LLIKHILRGKDSNILRNLRDRRRTNMNENLPGTSNSKYPSLADDMHNRSYPLQRLHARGHVATARLLLDAGAPCTLSPLLFKQRGLQLTLGIPGLSWFIQFPQTRPFSAV
jgi:hypothetical protein